jgi:diguanylate cyclase (GGDEF)-like protein
VGLDPKRLGDAGGGTAAATDTPEAGLDHAARPGDWSAAEIRSAARERLAQAAARDAVAQRRDAIAAARDQLAVASEAGTPAEADGVSRRGDASGDPAAALAAARTRASEARARAASDRGLAARDRAQAAGDRADAQRDIEALLRRLAIAETDAVTGIRARMIGLADLQREIDRARRTSRRLVIAYIAVVGFRAVADTYGQAAGEAFLQRAVRTVRGHLRSYDSFVRLGGEELLCVMPGARIQAAHQRLAAIRSILAAGPDGCEIRVGFAELNADDGAVELLHRAETELAAARRGVATRLGPGA